MKLNAPKKIVWLISLIVVIVAIVSRFVDIPYVSQYRFWVAVVGYVLLFLGTFIKGF